MRRTNIGKSRRPSAHGGLVLAATALMAGAALPAHADLRADDTVQVDSGLDGAHGRRLLFASGADNLVSGDANQSVDIFRRDLRTGGIERIGTVGGASDLSWTPNSLSVDGIGTTALFDGGGKVYARRLPSA
ncbi:hypothetical protein ACH4PU_33535 [Streptomyces sp. NPDC021100]|uniref:hypothetical protein n=1 Tax=Streptomyces sp. NPDC021100 TaxID=3365114 RepID=UPI00378C0029